MGLVPYNILLATIFNDILAISFKLNIIIMWSIQRKLRPSA
jgi:hypothetical protein